jgi:hypothetical protein
LAKREMIRRRSQLGIPLRGMERTGCLNLTRIERMIPLAIIRRRVYSSRTESGFLQYPRDCVRNSVKTRYRLIRRRVGGGMFSGRDDTTDRRENPGTSNEDAAQKTVKEKNQAAARHANPRFAHQTRESFRQISSSRHSRRPALLMSARLEST